MLSSVCGGSCLFGWHGGNRIMVKKRTVLENKAVFFCCVERFPLQPSIPVPSPQGEGEGRVKSEG